MTHRLLAVACGLVLLVAATAPVRAVGNPNEFVVPLPFTPERCRVLIDRGAPFALVALGGPDTTEVCIIIIGGTPRREGD
jgi:hypothetical protein